MSSRKNKPSKPKHNKRNKTGENKEENDNNDNANEQRTTITFKFPGRWATLSCLVPFNDNLTAKELLRKVRLSTSCKPPDSQKIFEQYFMDEIYPFISKHAQDTVNTKKDIGKAWNLQTNEFQKMYNKRADVLRAKWLEMRRENNGVGGSKNNVQNTVHIEHKMESHNHHNNVPQSPNSQTVIFKYYSVHSSAKTNRHIHIRQPTKKELLSKFKLSKGSNPPTAKQLFEVYYYDEILPFLKKSGQQSIRGKKDLSKVWQIQTKTFKNLYEDRARILSTEWLTLEKEKKNESKNAVPRKNSNSSHSQIKIIKQILSYKKMDCRLIRTLLNFSLFVECTTKRNCFMLLVSDQKERYFEYEKFRNYLRDKKESVMKELVYIHLRVAIGNFESDSLRLHTSNTMIKLCFINPINSEKEKELIIFQLRFNKLFTSPSPPPETVGNIDDKIDDQHIEANIDEETKILSINVPIL